MPFFVPGDLELKQCLHLSYSSLSFVQAAISDLQVCVHDVTAAEVRVIEVNNASLFRRRQV